MDLDYKKAQASYDKYAKLYAENTFSKLWQFLLNHFISLLPKNAKILDAGCGCGRDTLYLTEEGFDVMGIDMSEELLKEAQARAKDCKFKKMDFLNMEFPSGSFDGIWCSAGITSIPRDKIPKAIEEFNKVLKTKGILYASIKEGQGQELIRKKLYENAAFLYSYLTKQEIKTILQEKGFEILSIESVELPDSDGQNTDWLEIFAKKIS